MSDTRNSPASYIGHSSQHQWDVDPETYRPLLHLDHIADIENGLALPVILGLTCFTSNFADPAGPTLDESFVRNEYGGAIATFGSTSLGCARGHHVLHQGFHDALLADGVSQLGAAVAATQLDLIGWALFDRYQDLLDSFVLFGDPATEIDLTIAPWPYQSYLPLLMRRYVSLVEHLHLPLVLRTR